MQRLYCLKAAKRKYIKELDLICTSDTFAEEI